MLAAPVAYTDFNTLAELRASAGSEAPGSIDEAAAQFEALIIGMMLKSARQASLGEGLLDNSQTKQYLELMDQQVALELARGGGLGLAGMITQQLGGTTGAGAQPLSGEARSVIATHSARTPKVLFDDPATFVGRLLPNAAAAAEELGLDPKLLLAQAALETGWGQSIARHPDGRSTHNVFGIKAGGSWDGPKVARWTLEYADGAASRKREQFRSYESHADSFDDYVALIRGTTRYANADAAADAESYVRAVTDAGYATDPDYADKWLAVYHGSTLADAFTALKE